MNAVASKLHMVSLSALYLIRSVDTQHTCWILVYQQDGWLSTQTMYVICYHTMLAMDVTHQTLHAIMRATTYTTLIFKTVLHLSLNDSANSTSPSNQEASICFQMRCRLVTRYFCLHCILYLVVQPTQSTVRLQTLPFLHMVSALGLCDLTACGIHAWTHIALPVQ